MSTYLPELFAFLPTVGAVVTPSPDGKTVGIVLDLDHSLPDSDGLHGHHFLELEVPAAEALVTEMVAAITTARTGATR